MCTFCEVTKKWRDYFLGFHLYVMQNMWMTSQQLMKLWQINISEGIESDKCLFYIL